jgi:molecular chaperone HtpG
MTLTTEVAPQVHEFKAHTQQLLSLMVHSLYTHKEIFLRELISNASDALDRLRFESILDSGPQASSAAPAIRLEIDPAARTLSIHDNGIGMGPDEVVANLGTIARSGTQELLEQLRRRGQSALPELIGHFGVGFYSAFMVAERVALVTRRAGQDEATRWESRGDGRYEVAPAERDGHGTTVTLHLKPADDEAGLEDYADPWVLGRIVKRYSDFIAYPISLSGARDEQGQAAAERVLNSQKPLWSRPAAEVPEHEYREFYQQLSHERTPPLLHLAARAEGRVECQALLFVPASASPELHYHAAPFGLRLYARRVLVLERCPEALPRYLRFVTGVVDVLDLPLNISRQTLQESRHLADIRKWVTRAVLGRLADVQRQEPDTYLAFWRQFGRALKEGLDSDYPNRERLLELSLYPSSHLPAGELTTLAGYVSRMPPEQEAIYYLAGDSRAALEHAPHVEAARERGFEVLYLLEPVDDLLTQSLPEYAGKRLRSLAHGAPDWASGEPPAPELDQQFAPLARRLEELLEAHVKGVRLSTRLRSSPACLVGEEHDYTPRMERLLLKGAGGGPRARRTLELNPAHALVQRLKGRLDAAADDPSWPDYAELLLAYALVAQGSEPADPVRFTRALADLMERAL